MTIEDLRRQIEQRLTEVRKEADRLQAALHALGHGAGNAMPIDVAKPSRQHRSQADRPRPRAPRGATRQAVLEALAGGDAMTAGQLAVATALPRQKIAPELSKLVNTGELVKADRGYRTRAGHRATSTTAAGNGAERAEKTPAVIAVGRELDAGLLTRT